ncbi:MAG: PIG-L family deacetylase [Pirellulales bacterium]
MEARRVILMAYGEHKASMVAKAVEEPVTEAVAASFLQDHPNRVFVLDEAAAGQLTRNKMPWLAGHVDWTPIMRRCAVIWLARALKKPILKLVDHDYNENGLQDLLAEQGPAYRINIEVFREMQETITGWPGGKPDEKKRPGDIRRKTDTIFPKRVVLFSPHPDDDVISMGGTLIRLVDQGHEMHIAVQTSGNIAVFDADALRFVDFSLDFNHLFQISPDQTKKIERHVEEYLRNKKPGQVDSPEIQRIKGLIRRGETRAAARDCNVPMSNVHFLDLPFYETGTIKKKPVGEDDIRITVELLEKVKPHQIYAAGDLTDPHGTHRVCLQAVFAAIDRVKDQDWFKHCQVWLYRGAWQEWEPEKIEMAVPISPEELMRKRIAIFKHQSQKDRAMFPGSDKREFWQRAEDRNRATAKIYDQLGFAEYEAIEGFVQWFPT